MAARACFPDEQPSHSLLGKPDGDLGPAAWSTCRADKSTSRHPAFDRTTTASHRNSLPRTAGLPGRQRPQLLERVAGAHAHRLVGGLPPHHAKRRVGRPSIDACEVGDQPRAILLVGLVAKTPDGRCQQPKERSRTHRRFQFAKTLGRRCGIGRLVLHVCSSSRVSSIEGDDRSRGGQGPGSVFGVVQPVRRGREFAGGFALAGQKRAEFADRAH